MKLQTNVIGHVRRDELQPDQTPSTASHVPPCSGSSSSSLCDECGVALPEIPTHRFILLSCKKAFCGEECFKAQEPRLRNELVSELDADPVLGAMTDPRETGSPPQRVRDVLVQEYFRERPSREQSCSVGSEQCPS
jgi:hypothetical protein